MEIFDGNFRVFVLSGCFINRVFVLSGWFLDREVKIIQTVQKNAHDHALARRFTVAHPKYQQISSSHISNADRKSSLTTIFRPISRNREIRSKVIDRI
jgi:hypothetical protein